MAQGDPPVYQLVDSNGNVQAEIRHDLAQSLIIDQLNGSDIDFQQSGLSNIQSLSTERLSIADSGAVDFGTVAGGDIATNVISFNTSFDSPPIIVAVPGGTGSSPQAHTTVWTQDITADDFRLGLRNGGSSFGTYDQCGWIALAPF
jgi:hypothetical protein